MLSIESTIIIGFLNLFTGRLKYKFVFTKFEGDITLLIETKTICKHSVLEAMILIFNIEECEVMSQNQT